MNQYQQKGILVLVGIATIVVSFFTDDQGEVAIFRGFGYIALVLSGLLWCFDRALWKWRLFYDWLVPVPNLTGRWTGSGKEKVIHVDSSGALKLVESGLAAKQVEVEQQFSAIHLAVTWDDGSTSRFKERVPLSVSGLRTKVLTFSGVYDYVVGAEPAEPRNVTVSISMDSRMFNNRPEKVRLTYATGDRQGVLDLSERRDA